jgi:hypothetical protein
MAAISLFWYTNMAAVTSDENDLYLHLVNILRIITFNCLEGHSNFNNSDFNSFRGFWDTLYKAFNRSMAIL